MGAAVMAGEKVDDADMRLSRLVDGRANVIFRFGMLRV
jgi:hypothetical protein